MKKKGNIPGWKKPMVFIYQKHKSCLHVLRRAEKTPNKEKITVWNEIEREAWIR